MILRVEELQQIGNLLERELQTEETMRSWFVRCSVSGEDIALLDLRYWDVETQALYARPELMPVYQGLPFYKGT